MDADNPQRLHAHGHEFLRGVEQAQQHLRHQLEGGQAQNHEAEGGGTGNFQSFCHPLRLPCSVVKSNDGDGGIVDAEQGHEEEALELVVDAEHASGGLLEALENLVHAEIHHGADAVHNQRRNTHRQDGLHGRFPGPDVFQPQLHIRVPLQIQIDADGCAHPLANDRGDGCTGHAHGGDAEFAMDKDGVENNVDDGAGGLGDHGVHRSAGGLKQPLSQNLNEAAHGPDAADLDIGGAAFHRLGYIGLHGEIGPGAEDAEEHKQGHGDQHQKDAVSGGVIGSLLVFLPQAFRQQGVDAHGNAHAEADLHILHREGQGQGGHCAFGYLRDVDAVHHIVQCLHHHGNNHGQGHVEQKLTDGHDPHLVFLEPAGGCRLLCHFFSPSKIVKITILL